MLFEPILAACAPIADLDTAYDVELAVSALLGGAYAAADDDRDGAVGRFSDALIEALDGRDDALTVALLAGLSAVAPAGSRERAATALRSRGEHPAWVGEVGTARPTAAWALSDLHGDQVEYVLLLEYPDGKAGGPTHAVCALADFTAGLVKACWVSSDPDRVLADCRRSADADPDLSLAEAPIEATAVVRRLFAGTDGLADLPEPLAEERCFALSRLPEADDESAADGAEDLVADFLASSESDVPNISEDVVAACARLIVAYPRPAGDADRLRFSPLVVATFLTQWVPESAVVDEDCARALPAVLAAFIWYAGRRTGASDQAVSATLEAVTEHLEAFSQAMSGLAKRPSPAQLARRLIAAGVDPTDPSAVRAWLRDNL